MTDYLQAWQCIGCGRIEAPQTCIGVCRDRKVFMIGKDEHERALAEIARLRDCLAGARNKLLRFVHSTPRPGRCDESYLALRDQVRGIVEELGAGDGAGS